MHSEVKVRATAIRLVRHATFVPANECFNLFAVFPILISAYIYDLYAYFSWFCCFPCSLGGKQTLPLKLHFR